MSSISSVVSSADPYQSTNLGAFVQFVNDFNALGNALQGDSLSGAQSALAALQKDLPAGTGAAASQPFGKNTQANTDYNTLVRALQTGDLSAAQTAFAKLQTDLEEGSTAKRQPQRGADGTESENAPVTSPLSTEDEESMLDALA